MSSPSDYHIAVLSPAGLTPMVTINPMSGGPDEVVEEIINVLGRLRAVRQS